MRAHLAPLLVPLALALPAAGRAAPLALDDALALAARANADLLAARADVRSAQADRDAATATLLPRLDLTAAYGHVWSGASAPQPVTFPDLTHPGETITQSVSQPASDARAASAGVQLSQPLVDLGKLRTRDQAGEARRAVERQYDELTLTVAFAVTQRFYELVKQDRALVVLQKTAQRSQELVDRADALYAAGKTPKSETYAARVNLQNDLINAEAQQVRVAQARTALAQALGLGEAEALSLAVTAPPALDAAELPTGEPPPLEALLARARERRPALDADAARIAAARAGVGVSKARYLPSLSLEGTYTRNSDSLSGKYGVLGSPGNAYDAAARVVLSWNLFEGMGTRAAVQRAEAQAAHAEATAQGTRATVQAEVQNARAAVASLARQLSLAAENQRLARAALQLATERFAAGLASQLEERDASLKLSQAELTFLEVRIDHTVAVADLSRAVGGAL
jgi:outer membrane protein TolC